MASSERFVADLPPMDEEQLAKLYTWGKNACNRFDVHMKQDGFTLVVERKKAGSVREHQRMLRTNLKNWAVVMPAKLTNWLRLVPADDSVMDAEQASGTSDHQSEEEYVGIVPLQETHACAKAAALTEVRAPTPSTTAGLRLRTPLNLLTSETVRAY